MLMEESALLCRFSPYTDAAHNAVGLAITLPCILTLALTLTLTLTFDPGPKKMGLTESSAGSWLVGATVVASNIVSCAARAQGTSEAAGGEASHRAQGTSHGWHRVTVLTAYMVNLTRTRTRARAPTRTRARTRTRT